MSITHPSIFPVIRLSAVAASDAKCAMLARREYRGNGSEKRTFECLKCDFIETKIVDEPPKSSFWPGLQMASGRQAKCPHFRYPPTERRRWKIWRRIWKSSASMRRTAALVSKLATECKSELFAIARRTPRPIGVGCRACDGQRKWLVAIHERPVPSAFYPSCSSLKLACCNSLSSQVNILRRPLRLFLSR